MTPIDDAAKAALEAWVKRAKGTRLGPLMEDVSRAAILAFLSSPGIVERMTRAYYVRGIARFPVEAWEELDPGFQRDYIDSMEAALSALRKLAGEQEGE